ncbi:ATP-binding protein [Nocardia sp. NPDC051832]|uniref:ATP-binding protein n=1 Tax=Nocardia sp. NPDC051832 TaxID=3155673 RepID=UPI00342522E7
MPGRSIDIPAAGRILLALLMLQRFVCVVALFTSTAPAVPELAGLTVLWNAGLVGIAAARGTFARWMVAADLALAAAWLGLTAWSGRGEWAHAVVVIGFALALGLSARHLERLSTPRVLGPAQLRLLHDTALATLAAIAGGRVEQHSEQLRARAAQDVARIRRVLLADDHRTAPGDRLATAIARAEMLGLTVHYRHASALPTLPGEVIAAFAGAAEEALNNVAAHAGVTECWLTVSRERRQVVVRVVDRGRGFDPDLEPPGYGLKHSIAERISEVGGTVRLSGVPGAGSCVELRWPR